MADFIGMFILAFVVWLIGFVHGAEYIESKMQEKAIVYECAGYNYESGKFEWRTK